VPEGLRAAAEDVRWQKGKLHALRPVFRELGLPAAFVYEALEQSPAMPTSEIVRLTRLSRSAVHEALEVLTAWNLVARDAGRAWSVVTATSLRQLAEQFGVLEAVAAQVQRYRQDRIIWREWLAKNVTTVAELLSPGEDYPWELFDAPPDEWSLSDMAFRQPA
jgi:DNA-binding GntR family transcriptional regulator